MASSKPKRADEELVVYAPQKPNRIKGIVPIQPSQTHTPSKNHQKPKIQSKHEKKEAKENHDPFKVLGSNVLKNVEESMKTYKSLATKELSN